MKIISYVSQKKGLPHDHLSSVIVMVSIFMGRGIQKQEIGRGNKN
jgi:hypothetical protein